MNSSNVFPGFAGFSEHVPGFAGFSEHVTVVEYACCESVITKLITKLITRITAGESILRMGVGIFTVSRLQTLAWIGFLMDFEPAAK